MRARSEWRTRNARLDAALLSLRSSCHLANIVITVTLIIMVATAATRTTKGSASTYGTESGSIKHLPAIVPSEGLFCCLTQ